MKTWQSILLGICAGVLLTCIILIASRQPSGTPVTIQPAPTPAPLTVQVSGMVVHPGIYPLSPGSRVQDAIEAAGGLAPGADSNVLNLAARLKDGDKITVSAPPTPAPTLPPGSAAPTGKARTSATPTVVYPIDLNTATLAELDSLPGIGPSKAQDILTYREKHNGFRSIEEIKEVPGIGDATYNQLKELITVSPVP